MQVNVTLTRAEIMVLIDKKMAEAFPNLERVIADYSAQVPESIDVRVVLKGAKKE
jgi:hypothetical protein